MKTKMIFNNLKILILFAFLFIGSIIYSQPMNGVYTIGSSGNYTSFNTAVADLIARGVDGPVTFNVFGETFNEQISIPQIAGSSITNNIEFVAQAALVPVLMFAPSTNNYTVQLNGCDFVTFKDLTISNNSTITDIGTVVDIQNASLNCTIDGCILNGRNIAINSVTYSVINNSAGGGNSDNLTIQNNVLNYGSNGIYLSPAAHENNVLIVNNTIQNYNNIGITALNLKDFIISRNSLKDAGTFTDVYGIFTNFCTGNSEISKNKIEAKGTTSSYGLNISNYAGGGQKLTVSNNFISMINGITDLFGIYIATSADFDLYFNNVRNAIASSNNSCLQINVAAATNASIYNNIFANFGGGSAMRFSSHAFISNCNYNNLYSNGITLVYNNAIQYSKLLNWQTFASPKDANSLSLNPFFISNTDLHVSNCTLDAAGINIGIIDDIDAVSIRGATPDIGADEFIPVASPMSANYTIDFANATTYPSGTTFQTFGEAVNALACNGVSAPVVFDVKTGVYNEQITIPQIAGANVTNTITFRSQTGVNTNVVVQNSPTINNWVIRINGADYINWYNMTISNTNVDAVAALGNVIVFDNTLSSTSNNIIQGNIINGINTINLGDNLACITQSLFTSSNPTEFTQFRNNTFNYGSKSISLFDNSVVTEEVGNVIEGNLLNNFSYFGIQILNNENISIKGNTLKGITTTLSQSGMRLKNLKNNCLIENNIVNCASIVSNTGIDFANTNTTGTSTVTIKNNMVSLSTGSGANVGIFIEIASKLINVYHNSVNISSGTPATSSAIEINAPAAGGNFKIENNIFVNSNGGPAIKLPNPSQVSSCNYNDLFVTGTVLGVYDGVPQARLLNWRTATTFDLNSVSLLAPFTDATNLFLSVPRAMLKVNHPISGITTDITGQSRDAVSPNVGADENQCPPIAGNYTIDWTIATGGSNFQTFNAAINKLNSCGISGPLVFKVAGIHAYDEQITIPQIFGTSNTNTITFQSQSGTNTDVTINNAPSTNNWIVKLDATDHIIFKDITITNSSAIASIGAVVNIINGASFNTFLNCIFNGRNVAQTAIEYSVIYNAGTIPNDNITIQNCKINNGSYSIYFHVPALYSRFSAILNNTIQNYYYTGIYLQTQEAVEVTGNTISGQGLNTQEFGISGNDLLNKCTFLKNNIKVSGSSSSVGIVLSNANGAAGNEILVANNQIATINGTVNSFGIYINPTSIYFNIFNNTSVIAQNATGSSAALYLNTSANTFSNIKNNILANFKGGFASRFEFSDATWTNSNFNNLYTSGTNVGFFNSTSYALLTDWQAIGKDTNSISLPPLFTNLAALDLSLQNNSPCINKGDPTTNITEFNTDIINANRILLCRIDMGCYESTSMVAAGYNNIWLGCVSTDWFNPANWSNNAIPVSTDNILIPGFTPNQPTVLASSPTFNPSNFDAECKTIHINVDNGAKVTIDAGKILKVN